MINPKSSGDAVGMMVASLLLLASLHATPADVSKTFNPSTDSRSDRMGRERGILAPTEVTLPARTASLGSDELIWLKFQMGLTDKLQLSLSGIAIPVPLAGAGILPIPLPILIGGAGAGMGTFGAFDVGLKYRLLDESNVLPGIALGYDLVDGFVAGAGVVAGGAVGPGGAGGAVAPVLGLVNAQVNIFSAVAGKHFGAFHLMAGTYVIDNHNILPQTATLAVAGVGFGSGGAGGGAGGNSTGLSHLPTQIVPFAAAEYTLGPRASLMAEGFLRNPTSGSFGTTGARWVMRENGVARFRIDAAAVWMYFPPDNTDPRHPTPGMVLPEPWVSMSLYFG